MTTGPVPGRRRPKGAGAPPGLVWAKAAVAGIVAALTAISTALADGHISAQEWVTTALATVAAAAAVWLTPNATRASAHAAQLARASRRD
jgi:hypothetical protein